MGVVAAAAYAHKRGGNTAGQVRKRAGDSVPSSTVVVLDAAPLPTSGPLAAEAPVEGRGPLHERPEQKHTNRKPAPIASLRPPKQLVLPSAHSRPQRPSLLAQLQAIQERSDVILKDITATFGDGHLMTAPEADHGCRLRASRMRVGVLER